MNFETPVSDGTTPVSSPVSPESTPPNGQSVQVPGVQTVIYHTHDGVNSPLLSSLTSGSIGIGGDGSDGALSVSSGTLTIDLASALYVTKNYTSISITGTGQLLFSNPNSAGTVIVFKSQGNVEISSTATPAIDLRNTGPAGGAGQVLGVGIADGKNADIFPSFMLSGTNASKGLKGSSGGDSFRASGGVGGTALVTQYPKEDFSTIVTYLLLKGLSGASGGGGGGGYNAAGAAQLGGDGGAGGQAGGSFILLSDGELNFTGSIYNNGSDGANGTQGSINSGGGGGGGGGAGGTVIMKVAKIINNTGTINVNGGKGGNGANGRAQIPFVGTAYNVGGGSGGAGGASILTDGGNGGNGGYDSAHAPQSATNPSGGGGAGSAGSGNLGTYGSGDSSCGGGGGGGGGALGWSSITEI